MASITRTISQHVSLAQNIADGSNLGQAHILSENVVPLVELRPGGIVVEDSGGLSRNERHSAHLAKLFYSLDLRELYKRWYKKKGRAIEEELVNKAKATAVGDTLRRKCSEPRFQDILRRAFKEEEDDGDEVLLDHCKAVLNSTKSTPGTPDAFIDVHRVIYEAYGGVHILDDATLQQLASDGPGDAQELAKGIGCPAVAPLVKTMAQDLL